MFGTGIDTAIGILIAITLAHYTGLTKKIEKAFTWIGAGAVSFLLAGVLEVAPLVKDWITANGINYGFALFGVIGAILVFFGAIYAMYQMLVE